MRNRNKVLMAILAGLVELIILRQEPAAAATHIVIVGNYFFNPTNITVAQGDTVIWTNRSTIPHDSTHGAFGTPASQRLWASPNLPALTGNYRFTFTNTGFYPYICLQHIVARPEQTGTVTVVEGNFPPGVTLTSPGPGTRHPAPPNFLASANASDPDGTVTNVFFTATAASVGTVLLGSDNLAPYSVMVTNLPPASYQFRAIAVDNKGLSSTSTVVSSAVLLPAPLMLSEPLINAQSQFQFDLATTLGLIYVVEESDDLTASWRPVRTNTATGASLRFTRPFESSSPAQRSYRAFIVP